MKKSIIILLFAFTIHAKSQQPLTGTFSVTVSLKNIPDAAIAVLNYWQGIEKRTDSAKIVNGSCIFTGLLQEPAEAILFLRKAVPDSAKPYVFSMKNSLPFYLAPGKTIIMAVDSLKKAPYQNNSVYVTEYDQFTKTVKAYNEKYLKPLYILLPQYKQDTIQHQQVVDQIDSLNRILNETIYKKFVKNHPGSPVSLLAFSKYAGYIMNDTLETLFRTLSLNIQHLPSAVRFEEMFKKMHAIAPGKPAPDFTLPDVNGNMVSLSSFRGKYVLLDFWASWCHPCRQENPNVVAAYKSFVNKNFEVLSISLDKESGRQAWLNAIQKDGLLWTNICDVKQENTGPVRLYGIQAIPQNFLIGPDGKIVAINLHGESLQKKLQEVL